MKRIFALVIALILLFAACGERAETEPSSTPAAEKPTQTIAPTPEPTPEPTPTPPLYTNPLTGEGMDVDISSKRPFAVMINNIMQAMPQCGVSEADIIYEILAEGGITRMLAVFSDVSGVGVIGSMRSVRLYYLDIAQSYDAILVHAGGSPDAYSAIANRGIDSMDGVNGRHGDDIFYRDRARMSAGYEHSMFTSSELLLTWAPELGMSGEHAGSFDYGLSFADDGTPDDGEDALNFTVDYAGWKTSVFNFDAARGIYNMSQYGQDYIDGNTGEKPGFTNVLVLYADTAAIDSEGRLAVTLTGKGDGHFACGGKMVDITWSRKQTGAPFEYRLADGSELELGVGTSFISVLPSGTGTVTIND